MTTLIVWGLFTLLVLVILAFDLGILTGKQHHSISAREALFRTGIYFLLAVAFTVFIYYAYEHHWLQLGIYPVEPETFVAHGHARALRIAYPFEPEIATLSGKALPQSGRDAATMFFTGYLVEQSLSMDNIFVIALILTYFQVPAMFQHRVLYWGILGALIMRGVMIALGAAIIHSFDFVVYLFGAMLVYTAFKMYFSGDDHLDFNDSRLVNWTRRLIHVHPTFDGDRFFSRVDGRYGATPLFLALLIVESSDLLFAVDSIPAVFGITHDPFLVFTSNVFAILGLRSLYFALADLLDRFTYLKYSLVVILGFVGVKMLIHAWVNISPLVSLTVILIALAVGMGASWSAPPAAATEPTPEPGTGDSPT